jgi:uncharacterized cupin superfamily protein
MKLILICLILAGCGEYKCVEGKMAYRNGDVWVIPHGAYRCVEVAK